jgi:hypothetical protein
LLKARQHQKTMFARDRCFIFIKFTLELNGQSELVDSCDCNLECIVGGVDCKVDVFVVVVVVDVLNHLLVSITPTDGSKLFFG